MAANDEFPRGGFASTIGVGPAAPAILIPASPGITHVITDVKLFEDGTGAGVAVGITDSGGGVWSSGQPVITTTANGVDTWTGKWASNVGASVNASTTAVPAGTNAFLTIAWYDI